MPARGSRVAPSRLARWTASAGSWPVRRGLDPPPGGAVRLGRAGAARAFAISVDPRDRLHQWLLRLHGRRARAPRRCLRGVRQPLRPAWRAGADRCRARPAALTRRGDASAGAEGAGGGLLMNAGVGAGLDGEMLDGELRLLVCDLDGTLLEPDGSISERTRDAIRAVQAAGIR